LDNLILNISEDNFEKALEPFFSRQFYSLTPFNPLILDFCSTLSTALFQHNTNASYPEFSALAFWLREKHLQQLKSTFINQHSSKKKLLRVPYGLAFHLPPGSIEVMLVYSWICSLLVGNGNILRLPQTETPRILLLLQIIDEALSDERFLLIRMTTLFVRYGHIDTITAWISARANVRITWGSDATVNKIKSIPLSAHAKDIAFPDRFSFAAIEVQNYLQASQEIRQHAVQRFFNDVFLFDQSACSSPRILFWVGDADLVKQASDDFYTRLQDIIEQRKYTLSLGAILLKQNYLYDKILSIPIESVTLLSNELCVIALNNTHESCRGHCGQGLLYHIAITKLDDLLDFVTSKDQTLSYYGFSDNELLKLARQLNGRGISRIVPFGQALHFDAVWDGIDLLHELSQNMTIYQD
jgi:hypothetical protein